MTLDSLGLPGGSDGKCLRTIQETQVQSLGGEDLLEKEMTAHSTEEFNGLRSLVGYKGLDTSE